MKILIGDIRNTLTKLCLVNEKSIITQVHNVETSKIINSIGTCFNNLGYSYMADTYLNTKIANNQFAHLIFWG